MERNSSRQQRPGSTPGVDMGNPIRGTLFGGPNNKHHSIWGTILGSLILGNYHLGVCHNTRKILGPFEGITGIHRIQG